MGPILPQHGAISQALEAYLCAHLPQSAAEERTGLADAMRYAVLGGGKRLRAYLVAQSARLHGVPEAAWLAGAAAIECLHGYSLVHDDLPAMDDDDLRRGRPTVHRKWNEAMAILTGDALQAEAFALLSAPDVPLAPEARLRLLNALACAAGGRGMVLGQACDIAAETAQTPLTLQEIEALQDQKTGALIAWSGQFGPRAAGDDPAALGAYAKALGLAFQIQDDVLDVTASEATTGKRTGKDAAAGKATFVSLLGLEGAQQAARAQVEAARAALQPYGAAAEPLHHLARYVIARQI